MDEEKRPAGTEKQDAGELADRLEEAVGQAGGRNSMVKRFGSAHVELSAPFQWCGKAYTEIDMDFEGLTGRDMEAIDDEIGVMGMRGIVPAYSHMYQRILAARAAGIPSDVIEHLPLVDYNAVVTAAQNFLFVTG